MAIRISKIWCACYAKLLMNFRVSRAAIEPVGCRRAHIGRRQDKRQNSFISNDLVTGASRPIAHPRQPFDEIDKMALR
jgi:hypothetical protein